MCYHTSVKAISSPLRGPLALVLENRTVAGKSIVPPLSCERKRLLSITIDNEVLLNYSQMKIHPVPQYAID